jgi:hypothetical protein
MTAPRPFDSRTWVTLAGVCCLLAIALAVASVVLGVMLEGDDSYNPTRPLLDMVSETVVGLVFALVGGFIAMQRARNPIGWALLASGIGIITYTAALSYGELALLARPEANLPAGMVVVSTGGGAWTLMLLGIFYALLLFPTGKLPSRRWLLAARIQTASLASVWFLGATFPGAEPPFEAFENPLALTNNESYGVIAYPLIISCLLGGAAAGINLVLRFWRSRGEEREQYKWLAFAAGVLVISFPFAEFNEVASAISGLAFLALPISIAIAVLRYRLYDIDLIINRTLVYVPLTGILAGLYVALTGLSRTVFTELTDSGSDAAIALSTLAVVALLTPLKNQLQSLVDRHFKEQRDPLRGLRQIATETRTVLRALDLRRVATTVLEQLTVGLPASGAALDFGPGDERNVSAGDAAGSASEWAAVLLDGEQVARVIVWPPATGWRDRRAVRTALDEAAAVLAEVLSLQLDLRRGWSKARPMETLLR